MNCAESETIQHHDSRAGEGRDARGRKATARRTPLCSVSFETDQTSARRSEKTTAQPRWQIVISRIAGNLGTGTQSLGVALSTLSAQFRASRFFNTCPAFEFSHGCGIDE